MSNRNIIGDILTNHVQTTVVNGAELAMENFPFDSEGKALWMSEAFQPVVSTQATLGTVGELDDFGLYTIKVYTPTGQGTSAANAQIEALSKAFTMGSIISHSGVNVLIESTTPSEGFDVDNWWVTPFTIDWKARMSIN